MLFEHIYKNINTDSSIAVLCRFFLILKYNFCLRSKHNVSHRSAVKLRICLFLCVFCLLFWFSFNTTVGNSGLCEPYLLHTKSSFPLRFSESQGMLIWVKFKLSKFRRKNWKASLPSSTCALVSDKIRCFSQSERALHGNVITNQYKTGRHICFVLFWFGLFSRKTI